MTWNTALLVLKKKFSFSELKVSITFLNNIRDNEMLLEEAENEQDVFEKT